MDILSPTRDQVQSQAAIANMFPPTPDADSNRRTCKCKYCKTPIAAGHGHPRYEKIGCFGGGKYYLCPTCHRQQRELAERTARIMDCYVSISEWAHETLTPEDAKSLEYCAWVELVAFSLPGAVAAAERVVCEMWQLPGVTLAAEEELIRTIAAEEEAKAEQAAVDDEYEPEPTWRDA